MIKYQNDQKVVFKFKVLQPIQYLFVFHKISIPFYTISFLAEKLDLNLFFVKNIRSNHCFWIFLNFVKVGPNSFFIFYFFLTSEWKTWVSAFFLFGWKIGSHLFFIEKLRGWKTCISALSTFCFCFWVSLWAEKLGPNPLLLKSFGVFKTWVLALFLFRLKIGPQLSFCLG